jgi:hypothetical protein
MKKRGKPQCRHVWTVETEWALMAVVPICAAIIIALRFYVW